MKFGVVFPQIEVSHDPDALPSIATAVERLGYDSLLFYDHVVGAEHADREPPLSGPYTERDPFHDPFVAMGFAAAITNRIELATGVLILPQRQTVLVAQQAADVDLLSHGRLRLGVGTGWNWVEYDALGQDFASRGRRINEQMLLLRRLWSEPLVSFDGEFDHIERGCINPRPCGKIPMWIGGFSEAAFRRASRLGDGFSFAGDVDSALGRSPPRQRVARRPKDATATGSAASSSSPAPARQQTSSTPPRSGPRSVAPTCRSSR